MMWVGISLLKYIDQRAKGSKVTYVTITTLKLVAVVCVSVVCAILCKFACEQVDFSKSFRPKQKFKVILNMLKQNAAIGGNLL